MHSLPAFLRLRGRPVILVGEGEGADAKRRLLERVGARLVGEDDCDALFAVVVDDDEAARRLRARGVLVNATDRPHLCDWTLPSIVDRDPVLVAIGTGGVSAGLAAALRQRLETILPDRLGQLATALNAARPALSEQYPDPGDRRRALGRALAPGGPLDPLLLDPDVALWLDEPETQASRELFYIRLRSDDPDDLTLREARLLGQADRVYHAAAIPTAILVRARADAARMVGHAPGLPEPGLTVEINYA